VCARQRRNPRIAKAHVVHPAEAFRSAQHVETGQQAAHIELTLIIDEPLQDDDGAARWKRIICFPQKYFFGHEVPIVQHASKDEHIGAWQRLFQEVAGMEVEARRSPFPARTAQIPAASWADRNRAL
jgi:hypothetical protein